MSTQRLEQDDPLLFTFDATVVAHATHQGRPSVVLDRSAFYPESGGQMADRGVLGGPSREDARAIVDVQVDEAGVVHHVLEGGLPEVGAAVRGELDVARRRLHMALHSAQHLLSRALVEVAGAETTSSRLGESVCTIDVDAPGLPDARLSEAEALVQGLVDEDRAVRAWFPEPEELAALPLRRAPKAEHARVRIVDLGGFDVSPCGGTHVLRTAQIGVLRVLGSERYKGGTRISFSAGARARRELFAESDALRALGRALQTGPLEVGHALERLRASLDDTRQELGRARASMARELAERAPVEGGVARAWVAEGGLELVRQVAAELLRRLEAQQPDALAIVAGPAEGGVQVVVARGPGSSADARAVLGEIAKATGGRGGGRPERAEGRMPEHADVRSAVHAAAR
jgi:alanyl-tRNA synthetase